MPTPITDQAFEFMLAPNEGLDHPARNKRTVPHPQDFLLRRSGDQHQLAPPSFSSASTTCHVWGPTTPSTLSLKFFCNFLTATSVSAPKRPSTPPVSKPTALIRLCRRRTGKPVEPTFSTGWLWSASSMLIHVTRPTTPSAAISRAC